MRSFWYVNSANANNTAKLMGMFICVLVWDCWWKILIAETEKIYLLKKIICWSMELISLGLWNWIYSVFLVDWYRWCFIIKGNILLNSTWNSVILLRWKGEFRVQNRRQTRKSLTGEEHLPPEYSVKSWCRGVVLVRTWLAIAFDICL